MKMIGGLLAFAAFVAFAVAQMVAGYLGIEHLVGAVWAGLALFAALLFRITFPVTIGAFFGAMDVWGWHWSLALLFAAPGLALMLPGALAGLLSAVKR